MATYSELYALKSHDVLMHNVFVAIIKKAQSLLDLTTPSPDQVKWANNAISNPNSMGNKILFYILAANSGLTTLQITSATDAAIQTNVNSAVDALIAGGVTS